MKNRLRPTRTAVPRNIFSDGVFLFSFWHWTGRGESKQNTNTWHDSWACYLTLTVSWHNDQLLTLQHCDPIQEYSLLSSLLWLDRMVKARANCTSEKEQNIDSFLLPMCRQKWWYYLLVFQMVGKIKRSRSSKTDRLEVVFFSTISGPIFFIYVLVLRPVHQIPRSDGSYNRHPEDICHFLIRGQFRYLWWISAAALFGFS